MTSKALPTPFTSCLACRSTFQPTRLTARTQVAHKWAVRNQNRKNSFLDTVTVQLTRPLTGYGEKGRILKVTRGQMRNDWFPKRIARYVLGAELKALEAAKKIQQREHSFGMVEAAAAKEEASAAGEEQKPMDEQSVVDAFSLHLQEQLKERLDTDRKLHESRQMTPELQLRIHETVPQTLTFPRAVNDKAAGVGSNGPWAAGTPIFGSVTAADVAAAVRTSLAADPELAIFTVDEAGVLFHDLDAASDQRRLKALGSFSVEISIASNDPLRCVVDVVSDKTAEDAAAASVPVADAVAETQREAAASAEAQAKGIAESGVPTADNVAPSEQADELNNRAALEGALAKMRARRRGAGGEH